MVTGQRAFQGTSPASLIAAILEHEPPLGSMPAGMVPAPLHRVIHKALAKDPDQRWQTAQDLHDELKWIATEPGVGVPAHVSFEGRRRYWLPALALAATLLAFLAIGLKHLLPNSGRHATVRFALQLPDGTAFTSTDTAGPTPQLAVSPDGRAVVFVASHQNGPPVL